MVVNNIKKHNNNDYTGEIGGIRVILVFENCRPPEEETIKVTLGKLVTKNQQNFYYVKSYKGV